MGDSARLARRRIRSNLRYSKESRLLKECGTQGALLVGSLLSGVLPGNQYEVLPGSLDPGVVWELSRIPKLVSKRFRRIDNRRWKRLETGIHSFGNIICLISDPIKSSGDDLYRSLFKFKIWFLNHGASCPDQALMYLKWLSKYALYVAFGNCSDPPPKGESYFPGYQERSGLISWTPFSGQLEWVDIAFKKASRRLENQKFTPNQYRSLSELATMGRAMSFPSSEQILNSVSRVINTVSDRKKLSTEVRSVVYRALTYVKQQSLRQDSFEGDHVSLSRSACLENSTNNGGRGQYIISQMLPILKQEIGFTKYPEWVHHFDVTGKQLVPDFFREAWSQFQLLRRDRFKRKLVLGDIIYWTQQPESRKHSIDAMVTVIWDCMQGPYMAPIDLGPIVMLWASRDILKFGSYEPQPAENPLGLPLWESRTHISFQPTVDSLPVRGALSIESGMKTRLVTAGPASFITIGQVVRHEVAAWLSQDETMRIGIEEADKLWEFLRVASKHLPEHHWILSSDLTEATYEMPHDLIQVIQVFLKTSLRGKLFSTFFKLFSILDRTVHMEGSRSFGYPEDFTAINGSFMGENLSFMYLSLYLRVSSYIAACYAKHWRDKGEHFVFPDRPDLIKPFIKGPFCQIVGDDHISISEDEKYGIIFREVITALGGKISPGKDGHSPHFGIFCENTFCIPGDEFGPGEFGPIHFLDNIKPRALSGQAKIAQLLRTVPMLGHANLLAKQLDWYPAELRLIKRRASVLFWAANLEQCRWYSGIKAHFPLELGGFNLPLLDITGDARVLNEDEYFLYGGYFEALIKLAQEDISSYLPFKLALRRINMANPKGTPWLTKVSDLWNLVQNKINVLNEDEIPLPDWLKDKPRSTRRKYFKEKGFISVRELESVIARLEVSKTYFENSKIRLLQLKPDTVRRNFQESWKLIRQLRPIYPVRSVNLAVLAKALERATFGKYFKSDDFALEGLFRDRKSVV